MTAKNFAQIYALLVCFIATVFLLFLVCFSMKTITQLAAPRYAYFDALSKYDSNETYMRTYAEGATVAAGESMNESQRQMSTTFAYLRTQSPAQIEARRNQERQSFLEKKRVGDIMDLVGYLQYIGIAVIFLYSHYRIYKKASTA